MYSSYEVLVKAGWKKQIIATQTHYPVYGYTSPKPNGKSQESLWIIGGVHGEEPAGPNAFSNSIEKIESLVSINKIPVVFIPVANPSGYARNWRYFNEYRDFKKGLSVTDSGHALFPKLPSSKTADEIIAWVLKTSKSYLPTLAMDHHEDETNDPRWYPDSGFSYMYAYGKEDRLTELCPVVLEVLKDNGYDLPLKEETRFGEQVINGFVYNSPDGSIDQLLVADEHYSSSGQKKSKYQAHAVFVIETAFDPPGIDSFAKRLKTHIDIINIYTKLWKMVNEWKGKPRR